MSIDPNILPLPVPTLPPSGAGTTGAATSGAAGKPSVDQGGKSFDDHLADRGVSNTKSADTSKTTSPKNAQSQSDTQSSSASTDGTDKKSADPSNKTANTDKTDSKDTKDGKSDGIATALNASDQRSAVATNVLSTKETQTPANGDKAPASSTNSVAAIASQGNSKVPVTSQDKTAPATDGDSIKTPSEGAPDQAKDAKKETPAPQIVIGKSEKASTNQAAASAAKTANSQTKATTSQASSKVSDAAPARTDSKTAAADAAKNSTAPVTDSKAAEASPGTSNEAKAIKLDSKAPTDQAAPTKSDAAKGQVTAANAGDKTGNGQTQDAKTQAQTQATAAAHQQLADSTKSQNTAPRTDASAPSKPDAPADTNMTQPNTATLTDPTAAQAQAQQTQAAAPAAGAKMVASAYGMPHGVSDQVAVQLTRAALDGLNRFSIQLHPADLGRVDVRLDLSHDGHVTAMVTADRHDTLNLLQRDSRTLERSLQDLGFKMDSGGMQFSLKNQGEAFSQSSQPAFGGSNSDPSLSEPSVSQAVIAAAATSAMSNRMLDIRV